MAYREDEEVLEGVDLIGDSEDEESDGDDKDETDTDEGEKAWE